jgi:hypothetical protein
MENPLAAAPVAVAIIADPPFMALYEVDMMSYMYALPAAIACPPAVVMIFPPMLEFFTAPPFGSQHRDRLSWSQLSAFPLNSRWLASI